MSLSAGRITPDDLRGTTQIGNEDHRAVRQKRKQEAVANWEAARARWPHEKQIWELADVLME